MTRHQIREEIFRILFSLGFHGPEEMETMVQKYLNDSCDYEINAKDQKLITEKVMEIGAMTDTLDEEINAIAEGWKTNRMGKAELNILRLAVFEIRHDDEVPMKVAINEAIELAKDYCNDDAPAFINGILAHFAKD